MKTANDHRMPLFYFRREKKITRYLSVFMALAVLHLGLSCSYFKVREVPVSTNTMAEKIQEFNGQHNYAIINQSWYLEDLKVNEEAKTISGTVRIPSEEHRYAKLHEPKRTYQYRKAKQQPLNELHFSVDKSAITPLVGEELTISFEDIQAILVNDINTGRTVLNILAGTVGALFATMLIILATKSSCPFVYSKNGGEFVFKGELYPGVITPKLQRLDYLELQDAQPELNSYTVKVTNELREVQHTDLLQLWVVNHANNTRVALDSEGRPQTFLSLQAPKRLHNGSASIPKALLLAADEEFYSFNNDVASGTSTRELILEFDKPVNSGNAKLLLTAKNSLWLDYVFGKFNEQFGVYYGTFQEKQQQVSATESKKWANDQHIPLSVYLKTKKGWELVEQLATVGPMATRNLVVPLSLQNVLSERVAIKLECGFMFWELDYAGIDFSENSPFDLEKVKPESALDETLTDVTNLLEAADQNYLVQPEIGNEVTVTFEAPERKAGMRQSVFLVNQGYYNYLRSYDGIPNFKKLKTFREKHTFTRFSENMYKAVMAPETPKAMAL